MTCKKIAFLILVSLMLVLPVSGFSYVNPNYSSLCGLADYRPNADYVIRDNNNTAIPYPADYGYSHAILMNRTTTPACYGESDWGHMFVTCSGNSSGRLNSWGQRYEKYNSTFYLPDMYTKPSCAPNDMNAVQVTDIDGSYFNLIDWEGSGLNFTIVASWRYYWTSPPPAPALVIFSISETGSPATKLSNVAVTLSNSQTAVSNIFGNASINVTPPADTYTYTLDKTGYASTNGPLGGVGLYGGVFYLSMSPSGYLPAGYTRTTVHTTDGLTGNQIIGTTINLRDVENNTWVNSTSDADGQLIIDVLAGHTLDIYGSYPGVYTASSELGATAGGDYYLPLYPPVPTAPENFINLFVYMREAGNLLAISDVDVSFRYPSGTTVYSKSDSSGTAMQIVPNSTVIIISATKTGWNGQSVSITTPHFEDKQLTITLSRASAPTAAPTAGAVVTNPATGLPITDPITGLPMTVAPTLDVRTPAEKDTDLLNQLRDAGPSIIGLCILAIIFGLLKMIMKF